MTEKRIKEILESHRKWLKGEKDGKRANFRNADLSGITLHDADLAKADLRGANLFKAKLSYVNLEEADLSGAVLGEAVLYFGRLSNARLRKANLQGADLSNAFLVNADLSAADLCGARLTDVEGRSVKLRRANLQNAYLGRADLTGADLRGADLQDADLFLANLQGADLDEPERIRRGICIDKTMIGYKKCRHGVIVTLEIPKNAVVFGLDKKQYRTNVAKVLDFDQEVDKAVSIYDRKFVYRKGETVYPDMFSCEYGQECVPGIHFFRTKKEAEEYMKGE